MPLRTAYLLAHLAIAVSGPAISCSYPEAPSIESVAATAAQVYVFQLESAAVRRKDYPDGSFSTWVSGHIHPRAMIIGETPSARSIEYSVSYCGGHQLTVGGYYLVYVSHEESVIRLVPGDESILDVSDYFGGGDVEAPGTQAFIAEIREAAERGELPAGFPNTSMRARTQFYQTPPPPCP
jgi:hypothetical protein